ncbi:MAG: RIP metalloprotease RseP [Alphaproteobacteria bacterium]|nr:RIP metalloprotease RseP [Alphaproteobacteria bacterium]MBO4643200.1 RIP metalloprotease RseP [Alphaproteobacteria bacterium]
MSALLSLVYPVSFLIVLSLVVIVHEFGHFFAARRCGVKVEQFSLGFGRVLWSRKDKKGTEWKVCLIPLGGYVQMFGDADASSAKADEKVKDFTEEEKKVSFPHQPLWKKALISFAGPAMNYIFAIVLLTIFLSIFGIIVVPPVVSAVSEGSAAEAAGIRKDDRILMINGEKINEFSEVRRFVQLDSVLNMTVLRDGQEVSLTAHLKPETGGAILGVQAVMTQEHFRSVTVPQAFVESVKEAWEITADTLVVLKRIVLGQRSADDMRGPLGIAEASGDAARGGVISFILFIIQVSIGIGLVNLLPIPVLDGGHLLFYAVEAIIRRPVNEKVQNVALNIGLALLLCLLIVTSWNDIVRIFVRLFR